MDQSAREQATACATPLADGIAALAGTTQFSFHALPISCGTSLHGSRWRERYESLFGTPYLAGEMTVTGPQFDSFFFPERAIKEAEALAAAFFGADGTLFVTTGTTVSNHIALDSLYAHGQRVLIDKGCHQSIHFMLRLLGADLAYIPASWSCERSGQQVFCLQRLLQDVLAAQRTGQGYQLIVLTAHSYDGIVYDIPQVIGHLLEHGVTTRNFLIDEAWGSANYCHDSLRPYTAMNLGRLCQDYPDLNVVATQSAHKSLSCLRQASMIHYRGSPALADSLRLSRFRLHTTSPSYPILASLDLGRAQMQEEGRELLQRARAQAERFRRTLAEDPAYTALRIDHPQLPASALHYVHVDPSKLALDVEELALGAVEVKELLHNRHGIYVNRVTDHSLLLNFHIGINSQAVDCLLEALRELCARPCPWPTQTHSDRFIIPYPPGVPLVVPGEPVTRHIQRQIRDMQRSGAQVFCA